MSCEIANTIGTGDCEIIEKPGKTEDIITTVIASELVSEIIDNALDIAEDRDPKKVNNVGDILEKLSTKFQELAISEEKQKLCDMVESSPAGPFQGIGDQLEVEKEITKEQIIQHRPVEKKNRLTDLVKNSKQILAKLILNESKGELHDTKSEKLVKVVELDSGDQPYKVKRSVLPEEVRLPSGDSDDILQAPSSDEESLDEIQLSSSGPHGNKREEIKKTMTFPMAGPSKKGLLDHYRTLKLTGEFKKKKWNVGTKIMEYIRKQKAKRQGIHVDDGTEIIPQDEKS